MTDVGRVEAFERDGLVRVEGAVTAAEAERLRCALVDGLADVPFEPMIGAQRPEPGTESALWSIGGSAAFAVVGAAFLAAAESVFGPGVWGLMDESGACLPMPNLPVEGGAPWTVPHAAWHVDEPTMAGAAQAGALLGFLCLAPVVEHGGATVVVAGSHRRLQQLADRLGRAVMTDTALEALRAEPWWAALLDGDRIDRAAVLSARSVVDGVEERVVEVTGDAGDLVLVDPRVLHTVSANVVAPRLCLRLVGARRLQLVAAPNPLDEV